MDLKVIVGVGKSLDLQGVKLREWAEGKVAYEREQKAREREERTAERLASREKAGTEERALMLRLRLV